MINIPESLFLNQVSWVAIHCPVSSKCFTPKNPFKRLLSKSSSPPLVPPPRFFFPVSIFFQKAITRSPIHPSASTLSSTTSMVGHASCHAYAASLFGEKGAPPYFKKTNAKEELKTLPSGPPHKRVYIIIIAFI